MTRIYLPILTLLLCLAACTDDLARTDTPQPGPGEGLISLSLPGIVYDNADATSTRTQTDGGETDATRDEQRVTSLWFMAYPTTNGDGEALVQLLRPSDDELTHDYKTFNIRIKAGTYHIYVVANMPEIDPQTTEDELQKIILDYRDGTGENAPLVLPSPEGNGLPMVYKSEQDITITAAQSKTIQADLVFTCVKVRCTLWFDNTDGGHSNAFFGQNYLQMQNITGRNIATQAPLLPTGKAIENLPLLDTKDGALNGHYANGEYSEDAHETLEFTSDVPQAKGQWAYRTTFYLPEHYVTKNDGQSYLDITAALHDATDTKKANLQYTLPLGDESTDSQPLRQLPRGKYYDIVGKIVNLGGKIESNVAIMDWTVETVSAELESQYHLWVEKTEIGTKDTPLKAGDSISIALRTDAPTLTTEQTKVTIGDKEIDPYILTLNKDSETGAYTSVSIEVNPELAPGSVVPDDAKKFYIVMLNHDSDAILKKEIKITALSLEPYLIVTPEQYIVRISDIGNLPEHTVIFSYETNLTEVNVKCGGTAITTTGIKWSENTNVTITDSGLENKGTVSVTLNKPYDPAAYPTLQTVVLDYEATGADFTIGDKTTTVTIIPNAQTYRLHFRPVDGSWKNPHIYVYEPLYGMDGREMRIKNANGDDEGEHALQYSFTGKRTFEGWTEQGGTAVSWEAQDKDDKGNYWLLDNGWDPIYTHVYDDNIDYSPDFRTDCCVSDVNPKWPGVKMKEDTENPGWYYFDLPALAEPGKALIMFADGHSAGNDPQDRYPAHLVPGVPLYDYADKDGWFLYNWNESDQNEFVDDKPAVPVIETQSGSTLPDGVYRIYARRTHFWIWESGGDNYYTSINWPGYQATSTMGKDGENPYYYYVEMVVDKSSRPSWNPGSVQCAVTNDGNESDRINRTINVGDWKRVEGSSYYYYVIN